LATGPSLAELANLANLAKHGVPDSGQRRSVEERTGSQPDSYESRAPGGRFRSGPAATLARTRARYQSSTMPSVKPGGSGADRSHVLVSST